MKSKVLKTYWLAACGWLSLLNFSCNEIDSFGSDLLDGDWIYAKGEAIHEFTIGPAPEDSLLTFYQFTSMGASGFVNISFPLGKMEDPLFGTSSAALGTQLRFVPTQNLDFLKRPIDSVVLSLRYDTSLFYGFYREPMRIGVYGLTEPYKTESKYYSNHPLNYNTALPFGNLEHYTASFDSIEIQEDTLTKKLAAQLRIRLDTALFMGMLRSFPDTVYYVSDSFTKSFNGLAVVCEEGKGYLSVLPEHGDSEIRVYYKDSTGRQTSAEFFMSSLAVKTPFFQRNHGNSLANQCFTNNISGDSLLVIQGMGSRGVQLKMPYQDQWNGKFLNHAVLHLTVADLPGLDLSNFPLPDLLEIFDVSSGTRVGIDDVALAAGSLTSYKRAFGGYPIEETINGKTYFHYKMNITRHFQKSQKLQNGLNLVIAPFANLESPARLVLLGRNQGEMSARIELTFSE